MKLSSKLSMINIVPSALKDDKKAEKLIGLATPCPSICESELDIIDIT